MASLCRALAFLALVSSAILFSVPSTAGAGVPGTLLYDGATLTISASPGAGADITAGLVSTNPDVYRVTDNRGLNSASTVCDQVSATTVDCPAPPSPVQITIYTDHAYGGHTLTIGAVRALDALTVHGSVGDDTVQTQSDIAVLGDDGNDRLILDDTALPGESLIYTINGSSIARAGQAVAYTGMEMLDVHVAAGTAAASVSAIAATQTANLFTANGTPQILSTALSSVVGQVHLESDLLDQVVVSQATGPVTTTNIADGLVSRPGSPGTVTYEGVGLLSVVGTSTVKNVVNITGMSQPVHVSGNASVADELNVGPNLALIGQDIMFDGGGGGDTLEISHEDGENPYSVAVSAQAVTRESGPTVAWSGELSAMRLVGSQLDDLIELDMWSAPLLVEALAGDDEISLTIADAQSVKDITVIGGMGRDSFSIDDGLATASTAYIMQSDRVIRIGDITLFLGHDSMEVFTLYTGSGADYLELGATAAGTHHTLHLHDGDDDLLVCCDRLQVLGPIDVIGGAGADRVELTDFSALGGVYEIYGGSRLDRVGLGPITLSDVESAHVTTSSGDDRVLLLGTEAGSSTIVDSGGGNDTLSVFAAGLATIGSVLLDGNAGDDELRLFTGGTGSTFTANTIVTPGHHDVSFSNFELTGVQSTAADADGDGCTDAQEIGNDEAFGGLRDPSDAFDFFDIVGPTPPKDRAVDLGDTLAVLGKFGLLPADPGYDVLFDRMAGPELQPWRSRQASGLALGIDLSDALVSLQQFGHSCA